MNDGIVMNEQIIGAFVRLLGEDGGSEVVPRHEALARAYTAGLDLLLVAGNSVPPVCRIVDSGKYKFERQKAQRAAARQQRQNTISIKEIQLRPVTSPNDLTIKSRKAREFLDDGDKVKIVVRFKGRERSHKETGRAVIAAFLAALGEHHVEHPVRDGGNNLMLLIAPTKSKSESAAA